MNRFPVLLVWCLAILFAAHPCAAQVPADSPDQAPRPSTRSAPTWKYLYGKARQVTLGSLAPDSPFQMEVELTTEQAAVSTARLRKYFETVADKQLYEDNPAEYRQRAAENPERYKGHYKVLQPIDLGETTLRSYATETIVVWEGEGGSYQRFPARGNSRRFSWRLVEVEKTDEAHKAVFELPFYRFPEEMTPEEQAALTRPDQADALSAYLAFRIRKTFTLKAGSYSVDMDMELLNYRPERVRVSLKQTGPLGIRQEGYRSDERTAVVAKWIEGQIEPVSRGAKDLNKFTPGDEQYVGQSDAPSDPVIWLGLGNKYFGSIVYPRPTSEKDLVASESQARFFVGSVLQGQQRRWVSSMWLGRPNDEDDPTNSDDALGLVGSDGDGPRRKILHFDLFIGPKDRELFKSNPAYARLKYNESINTRSCFLCPGGLIGYLRDGLLWLLKVFAGVLFGNFGLAIFLLVGIVRVLLHPLTKKGQISMARMQKKMAVLKPEVEKIREKYANDKARQQQEIMKFYKEHGTGMGGMLGCLPMLLQMPIWIALFTGLNSDVDLRHAAFLPVWINDLAAPDALISWPPVQVPLLSGLIGPISGLNVLPLLLTVVMYFQAKFGPGSAQAQVSAEQAQQQKIMRFMMPVMMLLFFYNAPSGLTLYIMSSTGIGTIEQWRIRKHIREEDEVQAAQETQVKVSGKGPRSSRPKKPKGPFWTKRG